MDAQAILHTGVNTVALAPIEVPEPGPGQVLIETLYSCISPGTELRCLAGQQPDAAPWPYIPGYALTGRIAAAGPNTTLPVGTLVFSGGTSAASVARMWGGHVSHALHHEGAVFPLPEGLDPLTASIARLAAITYHGVRLSRPQPHEQVAVIGLGPIGQLSARLHHLTGARVIATDPVPERVEVALRGGVTAVPLNGSLSETFAPLLPGGADVVVDATGSPRVLADAVAVARDLPWDDTPTAGARYLVQGSYAESFAVPYQSTFRKEMQFLIPRDTQPRDIRAVLDFMARGTLAVRDLISAVLPPAEAPTAYAELREQPARHVTIAFDWSR
jgi:2-desacetyl-2-hydroxyethyl bacteriochlorophyllide A dehydrogenase